MDYALAVKALGYLVGGGALGAAWKLATKWLELEYQRRARLAESQEHHALTAAEQERLAFGNAITRLEADLERVRGERDDERTRALTAERDLAVSEAAHRRCEQAKLEALEGSANVTALAQYQQARADVTIETLRAELRASQWREKGERATRIAIAELVRQCRMRLLGCGNPEAAEWARDLRVPAPPVEGPPEAGE